MIEAKLASVGLPKKKYFEIKVVTLQFLSITSPAKYRLGHVLKVCNSIISIEEVIIKKTIFLKGALSSSSII